MKPNIIYSEISKEIDRLIQTKGITSFEFGTANRPLEIISLSKSIPKVIIWYSINPRETNVIYQKICTDFKITGINNPDDQYLYIKELDWD
jgi:hypothetical protein